MEGVEGVRKEQTSKHVDGYTQEQQASKQTNK